MTTMALGPFVTDCNDDINRNLVGNTFVTVACDGGGGIRFSMFLTHFLPMQKFHYHYQVHFNGQLLFQDDTLAYYTDRNGTHLGSGTFWFDCGEGVYQVVAFATSEGLSPNRLSFTGSAEVSCA